MIRSGPWRCYGSQKIHLNRVIQTIKALGPERIQLSHIYGLFNTEEALLLLFSVKLDKADMI